MTVMSRLLMAAAVSLFGLVSASAFGQARPSEPPPVTPKESARPPSGGPAWEEAAPDEAPTAVPSPPAPPLVTPDLPPPPNPDTGSPIPPPPAPLIAPPSAGTAPPPAAPPPAALPANSAIPPNGMYLTPEQAPSSDSEREREPQHRGLFARFSAGFGVGHVGHGDLAPKPGFKPIYGLDHTAPVLSLAGQLGGGSRNVALAAELLYEQMLQRVESPSVVGFRMVALGLAGTYYTDKDWFLTGHLRWAWLILRMADCPCFFDQLDSTAGPSVGLTLGKEWFRRHPPQTAGQQHQPQTQPQMQTQPQPQPPTQPQPQTQPQMQPQTQPRGRRRESSIGLAIQGNYARFNGDPELEYKSALVLLTFSHF